VVAVVFAGGNVALVLGVPAGTWLGERAGWRASFLAVAGLGAVVLVVVAALLPSTRPDQGHAARGAAPDARRFWLLVGVAVLATAGAIAAYTYVALFVTEVSGSLASSVGTVLLARGVATGSAQERRSGRPGPRMDATYTGALIGSRVRMAGYWRRATGALPGAGGPGG
jgi:predicted MFS family arabinose efflux permease